MTDAILPAPKRMLDCVTWNIHRGQGRDGRVDPARIVEVLAAEVAHETPDVLALQEADEDRPPHRGILDLSRIEAVTGLRHAQSDPELRWGAASHGFLGSILFLRPDIKVRAARLIDLPGHCHRGAVVLDVDRHGAGFRLITTHLSLSQALRAVQLRTIGQVLGRLPKMQTILLGDLNEWRPWGGIALSGRLVGTAFTGPARATFPATRPILALDRILSDRPQAVCNLRVLDGPGIRSASDHRPLRASVLIAPA